MLRGVNSKALPCLFVCLFVFGATPPPPQWARTSSFTRFLDHTQWRTTVGRNPLDEWSARRRGLYLTTHTTLTQQKKSLTSVGFEPTTSAGERPQTYALDRAATGTGQGVTWSNKRISQRTFITIPFIREEIRIWDLRNTTNSATTFSVYAWNI